MDYIIKLLQTITSYLQKRILKKIPERELSLNTLAPKILTEKVELDRIKPYLSNLKDALDADGINNIAVTGSYGSGKSTLLKTFRINIKPTVI